MKKTVPHGEGDLGIVKEFVSTRVRTAAQVALGLALLLVLAACGSAEESAEPGPSASEIQRIVDSSSASQQAAPAAQSAPVAPKAAAAAPPIRRPATVGPPSATTFRDYQQSRFESTAEDSVSTFSLDTDRTSFQLALNWARAGHEVDPDSVRAEEWINAFNYGYDAPAHATASP